MAHLYESWHISISHGKHIIEACHIHDAYEGVVAHINESRHTCQFVAASVSMSHATCERGVVLTVSRCRDSLICAISFSLYLECDTLQRTATHCNALQRTATHCNTLQRTATHCNALQLVFCLQCAAGAHPLTLVFIHFVTLLSNKYNPNLNPQNTELNPPNTLQTPHTTYN